MSRKMPQDSRVQSGCCKIKYNYVPLRCLRSDGVVRSSIPAFRADDPGPNPGRSILNFVPDNLLFRHSLIIDIPVLPEEVMSTHFFIADCAYQKVFFAFSLFFEVALIYQNPISLHFFHSLLRMISFIRARTNNIVRIIAMSRKKPVKFWYCES